MIILYSVPHSSYCAKTRILLRHKRLAWEERMPPGGSGSPAYKAIVPSGNLPTLEHEGLQIADSEAIAEYLEERFPDPPALPSDMGHRAKARERSRFHDTRLNPALAVLYPYIAMAERPGLPAAFEKLMLRIGQFGQMLDRDGSHPGEALTLGDCGFPVSFAWLDLIAPNLGVKADWPASVLAYRERLQRLDPVSAELKSYAPHMATWIEAKLASRQQTLRAL